MRGYRALLRASLMRAMAYRAGFVISIVGNLLFIVVLYFLWRAIYAGQVEINGLTFDEALLYVALGSTVFVFLKTHLDWFMSFEIREGEVVNYLVKPLDYQAVMLTFGAGTAVAGFATVTAPSVILLVGVLGMDWPLGVGTLLGLVALVLGFLISFCFDYAIGLTGFYTESIWGLSMVKETLVLVLSGALVPLQFFPEPVRQALMWLPFQAVYHTPLMMITQPDRPLSEHLAALAVQVVWVVALIGLTRLFYLRAVRVLRIAGG